MFHPLGLTALKVAARVAELKAAHDRAWREQRHQDCARIINQLIDLGAVRQANAPWPRDAADRDYEEEASAQGVSVGKLLGRGE